MAADENLSRYANAFFNRLCEYKYSYHFDCAWAADHSIRAGYRGLVAEIS
jgi:hypothetical protein